MSDDPYRDVVRREQARTGVAPARATLEIIRAGDRYLVGDHEFTSWDAAIAFVLSPEGEASQRRACGRRAMTTPRTARDVIDGVLEPLEGEMGYALSDEILDALAAAGFAVVPRGDGEPCAITWPRTPCECCEGERIEADGYDDPTGCDCCDGSGWVWGTPSTHKLEASPDPLRTQSDWPTLYRLAAVEAPVAPKGEQS
jgi:hypothetical protein